MEYIELLKLNKKLASELNSPVFPMSVYSNITLNPLKELLEFELRSLGLNAVLTVHNNLNAHDTLTSASSDQAAILWFDLSNLIEGFWYKSALLPAQDLAACIEKCKHDIDTLISTFASHKNVCINMFSALPFSAHSLDENIYEKIALELNDYLRHRKPDNFHLINFDKILFSCGKNEAFNWAHFYRSRTLYSLSLFKSYAQQLSPYFLSANGFMKKLLIVDCDHTLWSGIVGEDGVDGILMTPDTSMGQIYHEAQCILKNLKNSGVILAMSTKNNPADIDAVFLSNKAILNKDDFAIAAINWQDKSNNIKHILSTLNISADHAVFLDDNPFELELVKSQIPNITALLVPKDKSLYPDFLRVNSRLFYHSSITSEDQDKNKQYQQAFLREQSKQACSNIDEYLASLKLSIKLDINEPDTAARLAQLTQKTNQFNLCTIRQSESEIRYLMNSGKHLVFGLHVRDRFGDYGLTGCAIVCIKECQAEIVNFMMSCRILGRNIEKAFMDGIMNRLKMLNIDQISGRYLPTLKNEQVAKFYLQFGFKSSNSDPAQQEYVIHSSDYLPSDLHYIENQNIEKTQ